MTECGCARGAARLPGLVYYYHTNDRGSVLGLTDASGAVVASYRDDAWGNVLEATGPVAAQNPYRYAGYRQDDSTGLYYLKTRYHDAAMGRFLSQDAPMGRARMAFGYAGRGVTNLARASGRAAVSFMRGRTASMCSAAMTWTGGGR